MQIVRAKIESRATACVNMAGNKKARRDAGLFDALTGSTDQKMPEDYFASLAICAVRRETLRLALFL